MDEFNSFRSIYERIDLHRRSAWMIAQRIWSLLVMQGYNSPEAGHLQAAPSEIIMGAKALAQDIYNRIPDEPMTINPQILSEHRRKADRDDPYRFVLGAHRWLSEGRWADFRPEESKRLADEYDARVAKVRLVS